jgi:rhodanese-related sulfurtransferase
MKNIFFLIMVVLVASCSSKENNASSVGADDFKSQIDAGATVLDVRTPDEFASGHIENSINVDFRNSSFQENILMLDKTKNYAVYCASGVRSGKAADVMKEQGFASVYTLEGGIKTWKDKGLPLE